jgi:hypothetical protein
MTGISEGSLIFLNVTTGVDLRRWQLVGMSVQVNTVETGAPDKRQLCRASGLCSPCMFMIQRGKTEVTQVGSDWTVGNPPRKA